MADYVKHLTTLPFQIGPRLARLDLELTERCNNNCIHCCINLPAGDLTARAREMTTDQVRGILRQAADLGCIEVRFTGGEPLLRPDFEELYLSARRLGMKVRLFTNGRLVTPRLADLFAQIPARAPIEITVYGMRPESYDAVAQTPGAFAQFRRGIALMRERNVPFVVRGAVLPPNAGEIEEFETWARTLPGMTRRPGYALFYDLRCRRDDEARNERIRSLRLSPAQGLAVLTRDPGAYCREMEQFRAQFMGPPDRRLFNCGACSGHSACVDAYGRAQPCMGIRAPELTTSLVETGPDTVPTRDPAPLAKALEGFTRLRRFSASSLEYLCRCARCSLRGFCLQCPAKSWAEHGDFETPVEHFCDVAHAQARWLGWLAEGTRAWEAPLEGPSCSPRRTRSCAPE